MSQSKFQKAQTLVQAGSSITDACKQVKFNISTYYYWQSKLKAKPKKKAKHRPAEVPVVVQAAPIPSSRVIMFVGSTEDVLRLVGRFQ